MRVDRVPISPAKVRELDLAAPASAGRPAHLSAASGLVRAGRCLYVVADDELHLGIFRSGDAAPGRWTRIFEGELPVTHAERKAHKPDLEALALLPPFSGYPHGALLAIASGSTVRRQTGALIAVDAQGDVAGPPHACDLSPIFAALNDRFPALNIEGAFVQNGELCLLQRGHQSTRDNAVLRYALAPLLDRLSGSASAASIAPRAVQPIDLGTLDGVALGLTDGAALPGGDFVFAAVAENTADSYSDGPCAGAAVGIAGEDGCVRALYRLDRPLKIEGIEASIDGELVNLLLVTDADDAATVAALYSASIPSVRTPARDR